MNPENSTHESGALPPTDPMLASALSGIEQGLAQIRRMSREADELKLRLDQQQAQLARRESEVTDRLTALQTECLQLETDRRALADDRQSLARDRAALEELAASTDAQSRDLSARSAALEASERATEERSAEFAARAAELAARVADIDARAVELAARTSALDQRDRDLDAAQARLASAKHALETQAAQLAQHAREVDSRAERLAQTETALAERELAATQALAKAEQLRAETARRGEEIRISEERARRSDADIALLRQSLTTAQQQASQTIKALQEATTRAERAETATLDLRAELDLASSGSAESAQLSRERDQLRAAAEELRAKLLSAEERENQLSVAVKALKEKSDTASRQRDELHAGAERLQAQAAAAAKEVTDLRAALEAAKAKPTASPTAPKEIAELSAKLAAAEQAASAAAAARDTVQKELNDARLIIDDLRGQLDQHEHDSKELEGVLEQLRDRLRTEAAKAETFAAENQSLQARVEELESRPNTPQTLSTLEGAALPGPAIHRLKRIELCRKLMRDKGKKVRRVSEALAKRYEQCEQILSLRQEVLAAKRSVDAAFKKQQSTEVRSRAVATSFFLVAACLAIAGASWLVAGQVAPETYIAKAMLAADSPERQLNEGELREWDTFHQKLVEDPRFHEFAAQRLGRQGFPALTTPIAVQEKIKSSIQVTSNKPGEMTVEMRGVGRERTERELQAIAVALQSQAREAKDRRADGANTIVSQPAKAGQDPIDSVRLVYAGAIFGGAMLIFGVITAILWTRLSQVKLRFDQSQAVDTTEDESRWPVIDRKAA